MGGMRGPKDDPERGGQGPVSEKDSISISRKFGCFEGKLLTQAVDTHIVTRGQWIPASGRMSSLICGVTLRMAPV